MLPSKVHSPTPFFFRMGEFVLLNLEFFCSVLFFLLFICGVVVVFVLNQKSFRILNKGMVSGYYAFATRDITHFFLI